MQDVTRRSFIRLVTEALTTLPTLAGGLIVAPRYAHADDVLTGNAVPVDGLSKPAIIDVVAPWEVGFLVVDVTRGQRDGEFVSYPPVAGATVTVTSRFNQREARGVTGADGIANIDIRELAAREKGQDPNDLEDYHFNGKVSVVADGYRTFETALMYVEGGGGLQVPAHPADSSGVPYPHLVTFDLWDALYSQNEFLVTTANADAHTITVEVADVVAGESMTISLWVNDEDKARKSSMAIYQRDVVLGYKGGTLVRGTLAHANLTGYFLKKGHADALPEGASLMIAMSYRGKTYSWPLAVNLVKGVVEEPAGKENVKLSPIKAAATSGTALDLVWPKDIPLVGGGDLKFWTPQLPVNIYVNPFGYAQVTLKSPSWGYRKDSDNPDAGGWGKYPRKSVEQQWQSKVKTFNAMSDKTNALVSKPGTIQQIDLFKSFSVMFNFQLLALAKWDSAKGFFEGGVQRQITATLNFTLTESFFAGPIPVLITFAVNASLVFGLGAAVYTTKKNADESVLDALLDISRWTWD